MSASPLLNKPVELIASFALNEGYKKPLTNINCEVLLPSGFSLIKGDLVKTSDITQESSAQIRATVMAVKTGQWEIEGRAFSKSTRDKSGSTVYYAVVSDANASFSNIVPSSKPALVLAGESGKPGVKIDSSLPPIPAINSAPIPWSRPSKTGQPSALTSYGPLTINGEVICPISENAVPLDPMSTRADEWKPMVWGGVFIWAWVNNDWVLLAHGKTGSGSQAGKFSISIPDYPFPEGFLITLEPYYELGADASPAKVVKKVGQGYEVYVCQCGNGGQYGLWYPPEGQTTYNITGTLSTQDETDQNGAWRIYETIVNDYYDRGAWDFLANEGPGYVMPRITVEFPNLEPGGGTYYSNSTDWIYIAEAADTKALDVVQHEYSHAVMDEVYNHNPPPGPGGIHYIKNTSDLITAWVEGWAEFLPFAIQSSANNPPDPWIWEYGGWGQENMETETWGTADWDNFDDVEGRVAGALWDFFDTANDGYDGHIYDQFNTSFTNIWTTFRFHPVNTFADYWSYFKTYFGDTVPPARAVFQNTITYQEIRVYLTTTPSPLDKGVVTKNPDWTNYPRTSNPVTLSPVPVNGYHFSSWSGDESGTENPLQVLMYVDKTITANFAINTYTLTYTAGANGTISGTSPQTVNYGGNGTPVTAVAEYRLSLCQLE